MDFLGLRTLTVAEMPKLVNRRLPEKNLDLKNIDYNDPAVMEMIGKGKDRRRFPAGKLRYESLGRRNQPKSLEDIIAGIALYRWYLMDFIPRYIEGKEHPRALFMNAGDGRFCN